MRQRVASFYAESNGIFSTFSTTIIKDLYTYKVNLPDEMGLRRKRANIYFFGPVTIKDIQTPPPLFPLTFDQPLWIFFKHTIEYFQYDRVTTIFPPIILF